MVYSYPFGTDISDNMEALNASVFHGAVSSVQIKGGIERVFVDMQAKAGSSGGPVISAETNEVIGVLCGSYIEGNIIKEELNYIIPIKYVWEEFLKGDNE